jgi:glycosyltransferase involved in cell wall biosynthesis
MHIVILTRVLPFHSIGGMQVITWDLARAFVNKNIRVTCLTTSIAGKPSEFEMDGVNIVALPGTKPGCYTRNWWRKSKTYVDQHFLNDCNICFSVSASGFSVTELKKQMPNTYFVFQGHGTSLSEIVSKFRLHTVKSLLSSLKNIKWLPIDLVKYQSFDGMIASGERVYKDLNGKFYQSFLKEKPLKYLPNGIFTDEFFPCGKLREEGRNKLNMADSELVFLLASRLHKQKGIQQALSGLELLFEQCNKFKVVIIGDGPDEQRLKHFVSQSVLADSVSFIGAVSINDLPMYLNASDAYVFPTLHEEGLPLLPLEALACGIPVFASQHLSEINKLDYVYSINPRSPHSIKDALLDFKSNILNKPKKKSLLPYKYSMQGVVEAYLNFFEEIKNERK